MHHCRLNPTKIYNCVLTKKQDDVKATSLDRCCLCCSEGEVLLPGRQHRGLHEHAGHGGQEEEVQRGRGGQGVEGHCKIAENVQTVTASRELQSE